MHKTAERVGTHHPQQPKNDEDDGYRCQQIHIVSFPGWFGFESESIFDGDIVLNIFRAFDVLGEVACTALLGACIDKAA
jgi:hypothetical protein